MDKQRLNQIFNSFNGKHLLLIGDVMLDAYIWGEVLRMSPEAPVPVLNVTKREERLGGLANVALNLKELGARVSVCSVIGNDHYGKKIIDLFKAQDIDATHIILAENRTTTVKTRVINKDKHVMRIDEEIGDDINHDLETRLLGELMKVVKTDDVDAVLFEDYNKGVLTTRIIQQVIEIAKTGNIPVAVDPKKKNFFTYKGVTLFKPNLKELTEGLKLEKSPKEINAILAADHSLRQELKHSYSLITLSEHGVFVSDGKSHKHLPAHDRNIADVSGAGDTVIAVAALCLAAECEMEEIAFLSNLAGGIVCEYVGVVPISKQQLFNEAVRVLT